DYLMSAALAGRMTPDARKRLSALYSKTHNGSAEGLEAALDARYKKMYSSPFEVQPYKPTAARTNRVVLAEVFTGSGCPPCVAADVAFDVAMERYPHEDLAVLMFHQHIPQPDPMSNPASQGRAKFYSVQGVPSYVIDGKKDMGGGPRDWAKKFYDKVNRII